MKFLLPITLFACSVVALAQSEPTPQVIASTTKNASRITTMTAIDATGNDEFSSKKLESAVKLKYTGIGVTIAGLVATANDEPEAGVFLSIAGAVVSLYGVISQDIQLVRLARKNSTESDKKFRSRSQQKSERSYQSRSQQKFERDN